MYIYIYTHIHASEGGHPAWRGGAPRPIIVIVIVITIIVIINNSNNNSNNNSK